MKLVLDEKLKHRLIGLAVIISVGVIFAPAIMKKSSQHMDNNFSVNVKMPPKPLVPDVVINDEKEVFKTIKVAKVDISPVSDEKQLSELVKAELINADKKNVDRARLAAEHTKAKPVELALNQAAKTTAKNAQKVVAGTKSMSKATVLAATKKAPAQGKITRYVLKKPQVAQSKSRVKQDIFAVQLASFSQISNAQSLVARLKSKGYKANFVKTTGRQGAVYKVYAGHSPYKIQVMKLKTQLASAMQLNGFVVNTGVS